MVEHPRISLNPSELKIIVVRQDIHKQIELSFHQFNFLRCWMSLQAYLSFEFLFFQTTLGLNLSGKH